jgi:hypothetical protein
MNWVAAKRVFTNVIEFKTFRDWANKHLVDNAMNRSCFSSYTDMPVFILPLAATASSEPNPAIRLAIKKSICPDAIRQIRKFHALSLNKLEAVA